jgi:hypothetical protein
MSNLTERLLDLGNRWNLALLKDEIQRIEADFLIFVGFLGDFNSGKSTLINEIVGIEDLLPTGEEPCTAVGTKVIAVDGLTGPEFYRCEGDSTLASVGRPTFDDTVQGKIRGLPIVHVPSSPRFPSGFVLVDTAGLGSLDLAHESSTIGELLHLDATVLCVDASKGGLSASISNFLNAPAFRHLKHSLLLAVTKADLVPSAVDRNKIVAKIASDVARAVGFEPEEAKQRVFSVSAGPEAKSRDLSSLEKALEAVVMKRRASIQAERQARATRRLLPLAIRLLEQHRSSIREPDEAFRIRVSELESRIEGVRKVRKAHEDNMEKLKGTIRRDVKEVCERFAPDLAGPRNAAELDEACGRFSGELERVMVRCLRGLDESFQLDAASRGAEMKRMLSRVNDTAAFGKMVATACIVSFIAPGAGHLANAAEAVEGATVQTIASKGAAQIATQTASRSVLADIGLGVLRTLNDINPVNFVGDVIAEQVKLGRLNSYLACIADSSAREAARVVEAYYEKEYFAPAERELESLKKSLQAAESERRTDLNQRLARCATLLDDIEQLRKLGPAEVEAGVLSVEETPRV